MKRKPHPVHLQLIGNGKGEPFLGVYAVPGRLPTLLRFPGESVQAFSFRVLHLVQGHGPVMAMLMYRSDADAPSSQVPPPPPKGTVPGNFTRVIRTPNLR